MLARCRGAFCLLFVPLTLLATGCRNKTDLVETELRTKDTLYRQALEEQRRTESRVDALQQENEALRQGAKITPEQAAQTYSLRRIVLARSTGGSDLDNVPGDEMLTVVIEPRDGDDHTIKAPGALQIFALEVSPQGIKTPLCMWDIPPGQLRQSWKQGLLSLGYTLTLPWKVLPVVENIRVVARFVTPDQRVFEADKDIKVRLVPGAAQKRPELMPEMMPMPCPVPTTEGLPFLVPTSKVTSSSSPAALSHRTDWQPVMPASTGQIVTISRPQPIAENR